MFNKDETLFCFALKEEAQKQFDDLNCLFTGIGKVNSTLALTKYLALNPQIKRVVNLGTCGAKNIQPSQIVCATTFYQRDWFMPLPGFSNDDFEKMEYGIKVDELPNVSCGTGDSFIFSWDNSVPYDVVDMEAFALATVCKNFKVDFICIKSISDSADENSGISAAEQWSNYLTKAAFNLRKVIQVLGLE